MIKKTADDDSLSAVFFLLKYPPQYKSVKAVILLLKN